MLIKITIFVILAYLLSVFLIACPQRAAYPGKYAICVDGHTVGCNRYEFKYDTLIRDTVLACYPISVDGYEIMDYDKVKLFTVKKSSIVSLRPY